MIGLQTSVSHLHGTSEWAASQTALTRTDMGDASQHSWNLMVKLLDKQASAEPRQVPFWKMVCALCVEAFLSFSFCCRICLWKYLTVGGAWGQTQLVLLLQGCWVWKIPGLIFCLWNAENLYVVDYFSWQNPSFSLLVECFSWSCLVLVVRHGQKCVCGCVSVCTAVPLAIVHGADRQLIRRKSIVLYHSMSRTVM